MDLTQALALIEELKANNKKIIEEKKEVLKLFEDKDKEDMTESEKKIALILEQEGSKRTELEKKLEAEQKAREQMQKDTEKKENERITKLTQERIAKVAKGDAEVAKKLEANLALLAALPKTTDTELDTAVNMAYNMMGAGAVNPLAAVSATGGGTAPVIDATTRFTDTEKGKAVGKSLGLSFSKEAPKAGE